MSNTELQNNLTLIKNNIEAKILKGHFLKDGTKYNPFKPCQILFQLIQEEILKDKAFKANVIDWLNKPSTITTRDIICNRFESKINNMFKNDSKYPMPHDNAMINICQANYEKAN